MAAEEKGNSKKKPPEEQPWGMKLTQASAGGAFKPRPGLRYTVLFGKAEADEIFQELEKEVGIF